MPLEEIRSITKIENLSWTNEVRNKELIRKGKYIYTILYHI